MTMHYKVESFGVQEKDPWWRKLGRTIGSFMKRVSNRENIVMEAPWPSPSRRHK